MLDYELNKGLSLPIIPNTISQPAVIIDLQFKIVQCNPAFKKLLGKGKIRQSVKSMLNLDEVAGLKSKGRKRFFWKELNSYFYVSPVFSNKEKKGYLIAAITNKKETIALPRPADSNKELREKVLTLLLNNNIAALLETLLDELLEKSGSTIGIFVNSEHIKNSLPAYKVYSRNDTVSHSTIIRTIESILPEIKNSLLENKLSSILNFKSNCTNTKEIAEHLLVIPGKLNDSLLELIILGSDRKYTRQDVTAVEEIIDLISFAAAYCEKSQQNNDIKNKYLQSQKLETFGKLSSGIAHDLNNLLSGIFGSINLLKKKLPESGVSYLIENIESCSIRAVELTKGLLNYGKQTPRRRTLIKSVNLLKELFTIVEQNFPERIQIHKSIHQSLFDITGNPTEIYRVLFNLLINAKEAIKGSGVISLDATNFVINKLNSNEYPLLKPGSYVKFTVKDTGEGISEENISKIFEPYFSTKQKENSSGLGLYITYGIVKAHNGFIDVKSKLHQGTQFDVYIPAYNPNILAEVKTEKIILLADDEEMLRDLLAELLESYNYQVICVQNGLEVLKVLTEEIKVDLLIIDYKMPEMDGITCIQRINELGVEIPIILSTGSSTFEADIEIDKLRLDSILRKPYEFEQMLYSVQSLI